MFKNTLDFFEKTSFTDLERTPGKIINGVDIFLEKYKITPSIIDISDIDISELSKFNIFFSWSGLHLKVQNDYSSSFVSEGYTSSFSEIKNLEECLAIISFFIGPKFVTFHGKFLFIEKSKNNVLEFIKNLKISEPLKVGKIKYLTFSNNNLDFKSVDLNSKKINYDLYNEGFKEIDSNIKIWAQNWNETGLVILHGEPGTGKTSYIRHLISEVPEIVYIPSNLIKEIGSPNFINFLQENGKKIFVVEDAEDIIVDGPSRSMALQNLLNATDGILGDIIQCKFILTFNADILSVDKALLRQGRAKIVYQFKKLTGERVSKVLKDMGKENLFKDATLAEIFNDEIIGNEKVLKKDAGKVGF